MIIKEPDSKQRDLDLLQQLLVHPNATQQQIRLIETEIRNIKAGDRGEQEAAYEIKVRYGESKNFFVIHDLRIIHQDLAVQIDHLILDRLLNIYVCESKHFSEGISINEHGEFTSFYLGKPRGVPSPITQNIRHIALLSKIIDSGAIELPKRLGFTIKPTFKSYVLISKNARIQRPKRTIDGIESLIKSDQLAQNIDKYFDDVHPLTLTKLISSETLLMIANNIKSLHSPIEFDWHAKFGLEKVDSIAQESPPMVKQDAPQTNTASEVATTETQPVQEKYRREPKKSQFQCKKCEVDITYRVAQFCWFHKPKFHGDIYCMDCQKEFS